MSQVMTPQSTTTPCGAQISPFGAMTNPMASNNATHRVDLLVSLREIWGSSICNNRGLLYKMVAGTKTDTELHSLLKYFYIRHPAFTNFVNQAYYFGNQDVTLIRRIVVPARERILSYQSRCVETANAVGVAVVGFSEDYLYLGGPIDVEGCETV